MSDECEEVVTLQGSIFSVALLQSTVMGGEKESYWSTIADICTSLSIRHVRFAYPSEIGERRIYLQGSGACLYMSQFEINGFVLGRSRSWQ